jgi:predicted permease
MVINHLFPVFALVLLGVGLKHFNMTSAAFYTTSDRLIYFIFFPVLLFWKIGGASQTFTPESLRFYLAALAAVLIVYILSTLYIIVFRVPDFQAGSFSQSCYRFNTYIGMAIILTVWGEAGVAQFGVLIGMVIPIINFLAISTLIWFSGRTPHWRYRLRMTLKAMITNPLILACAAGLLYARWINSFPIFMENTLRLSASVTLPLALLSIGGSLTLETLNQHLPLALVGALFKLLVLPLTGYALMQYLAVEAAFFPVGMLFFALPTSTAMYVLSAQLNSDTQMASAAIVLSTGLSFFSLSVILWLFHG